jgi:hypothetical protein
MREVQRHLERADSGIECVLFVVFGRAAYERVEKVLRGML